MAGLLSGAEITSITATVASVLDQSLPLYRKTTAADTFGHSTETWNSQGNVSVNIIKPSATQLQSFAGIIGSKRALILRAMQTTDIREGDRVVFDSLNWLVQNVQNADSYTVTREFLITVIS